MKQHFTWFCVFAAVALATTPDAAAQGTPLAELTESQERELIGLIDAGRGAYDRGEFDRALRYFRDAYDLLAHPDILYRIALCHERLGEDEEAVRYYRQFLAEMPDAPERGRIENTIDVIERRLAARASKLRIHTEPPGASISINDRLNGVAGLTPTELPVAAGRYTVIIDKKGYESLEEQIDVPTGQTVVLRYSLRPVVPTPEPPSMVLPYVLLGTTAVAGVSAVAFGLLHRSTERQIERILGSGARTPEKEREVASLRNDSNLHQVLAISSAGLFVVGAVTTTVVWIYTGNSSPAPVQPTAGLGASVTPDGFGLRWSSHF